MCRNGGSAGPAPAFLEGLWPELCARYPVLGPENRWSIVWHGSMTRGVDDDLADIDLWCLGSRADVERLDHESPTRFFNLEHRGRTGHLNVEVLDDFDRRITACDLPLIAELRCAHIVADPDGAAFRLLARAATPMPDDVRAAWFRFHYVEFRGEHRSTDNPAARGHAVAVFLAAAGCLREALRAAMVLDGEPYPYDKWLYRDASRTPTGAALAPGVAHLLDQISGDSLRAAMPEAAHPLVQGLKGLRSVLIERARQGGLDGDYLTRWWLHMTTARAGITTVRWP